MFKNYLTVALRNIIKEKSHLAINLFGLSIGLIGFVMASLFADYEENYDTFFEDSERIHLVYSRVAPQSNMGIPEINGIYSALAPLYKAENPDVTMARLFGREIVVANGDRLNYEDVHFVDPEFTRIFKFEPVDGDLERALSQPNAIILTEKVARRYFGDGPAVGQVLTFASKLDMEVAAVIRDLPINTHLRTSLIQQSELGILATTQTLTLLGQLDMAPKSDRDIEGTWGDLRTTDRTYLLADPGAPAAALADQLNETYKRHAPEDNLEFISGVFLRPVKEANLLIWQVTGIPGMAGLRILGLMILGIACINFVNLATAQAMGRAREVGIRKSLGARPWQLAVQFLTESVVMATAALLVALAAIEYLVPVINEGINRNVSFSPLTDPGMLAFLVGTALSVGLLSGAYPAFLLARLPSTAALSAEMKTGKRAGLFRRILVVTQFAFSVFLVVSASVIFAQNTLMRDQDYGYERQNMIVVQRLTQEGIKESFSALKSELERLPGVMKVAGSSQVPFEQSHHTWGFWPAGDVADNGVNFNIDYVDFDYIDTYGIQLIEGRDFDRAVPNDILLEPAEEGAASQSNANAIINRLAARRMGFENPAAAIGQALSNDSDDFSGTSFNIVGVMEDADFLGFFNDMKPWIFIVRPDRFFYLTVRPAEGAVTSVRQGVDEVWARLIPEYPIQVTYIDEIFDGVYNIFEGVNRAVAGFAGLAILIACIGLFGLSAFVAETRTKEIGIRKVMGASTNQIIRLLVWQFSKPVVLANLLAFPLAFLAMDRYLAFFSERVGVGAGFFAAAALASLALAALTVGSHALRIARRTPVMALRYE
jgi:putative ABC transport system permease protein